MICALNNRRSAVAKSFVSLSIATLTVAALAAPSHAKTPIDPVFSTIDLPIATDHPVAVRTLHHTREAASHSFGPRPVGPQSAITKLSASTTAANYANTPKTTWSIEHQDILIDLNPALATLKVSVDVTVRTEVAGLKKIVFVTDDFADIKVTDALGTTLTHKHKMQGGGGYLSVDLPHALTPATDTIVTVNYTAKLNCDEPGSRLRPCNFDNKYSTVAFFRYYLTHSASVRHPFTSDVHILTPHNRRAAAPGVPKGATKLDDGRLSWHFHQPERTQSAGFSIAAYGVAGDEVGGGVASTEPFVRVYSQGGYAANGATLVKLAKSVLSFAGERMGPFPWVGINLIQVAQNFGGGYAPLSGTFMLEYVFGAQENGQGWTSTVELTAHELAHQWWGNHVRPATNGDTSLSESLAEFTSCLYTENTLKSRSQMVGNNLNYVYTVTAKDDRPLGSAQVHYSPKYVSIMYHKGAVVMDMMRVELGEQMWLDSLKAFITKFGRDYARWQDLNKVVNEQTGEDYDWYFKQWFAKTGFIRGEIAVNVTDEGKGSQVKLRFAHLGAEPMRFRMPIRVTYTDRTTENAFLDILPQEGTHLSFATKSFDKRVAGVRPDLGRRLLRRFQLLTPGDVDLNGLADGRDLIEMGFRMRRAIVYTNKNGKQNFYPNSLWDEIYDVVPNYRLDSEDLEAVAAAVGTEAIEL